MNCSQSSIMKLAALSCAFDKYDKDLFLSEHRRCYNEIIAYCNKLVYNDKLEAKRGSFHENKDNALLGVLPAMGHVQVTVAKSKKKDGSRCNLEEAEQIVLWLRNNFDRIVEC